MSWTRKQMGWVGMAIVGSIAVPMPNANAQPGFDGGIIFPGFDGGIVLPDPDSGIVFPDPDGSIVIPSFDGGVIDPGFDGGVIDPGFDGGVIDPGFDGSIVIPVPDASLSSDASVGGDASGTVPTDGSLAPPPVRIDSGGGCAVAKEDADLGSAVSRWLSTLGFLALLTRRTRVRRA